jgi:hypothetical protein
MNPLDKTENKIAGFIYRAQLLQESVSNLSKERAQKSELSFENISQKVSLDYFDKALVQNARKMSAVYIAIASFENMLRGIVEDKLLDEKGANWWNSAAISSDIRKSAERKMEDEKQNRWHTPRGLSPIYFTELKDLVSIVCKPQNWDFFVDLFGDPDWVKHSVRSLERSRNVIMHSGQLNLEDIERVGITIRDWIRQVGG